MFHSVSSKVNFPRVEENILNFWRDNNVFERSIETRYGSPRFVLYEGPPTANGNPGIHHVMGRVLRDIIPRYKAMKGYYTPRIAGWDTHGLPVELEIERELGFSGKHQIEEYGIERFNALCRESVFGYLKEWKAMTERIAFWIDIDNAYFTMKSEYIETVWWTLKQMWDKGLVYQGYRVTPHCPRCETSLSSHEVAQGYQDNVEDPSVYVKFKLSEVSQRKLNLGKPAYFLAWTTTPWTLPGNTALAVAADAEYAVVELDDEYLILASTLLGSVGVEDFQVVERIRGSDLMDLRYEPLFNPHEFGVERRRFQANSEPLLQKPDAKLTYRVINTDFVSMEDGTGIVHEAPAYGDVDFEAGKKLGVDFVHHVDLQGNIIGNYSFSGKFIKDADPLILDDLKSRGLLYRSEKIHHTYPFCWRCEAPLLYYAKETWYIKTTAVKESLITGNNEINWYPEHVKYGRFGDWLENNVDWAFSRERYWGTPLPIWRCESCGQYECIGSVKNLREKAGFAGLKEPLDLHRPFVDELTFDCPKCGARMRRVPEVIDCWFDSGAMPLAQWHYPFENDTLLEDGRFPADYICEAVDQTRGWFYSLHAISTLLFDRPSFRNVISHGHILDAKGEKMSKSKGNVVNLWAVIDKYGADALRWYLFTAVPMGNSMRFDEGLIAEIFRRFLMTIWNVYSFFSTYANIDRFTPDVEATFSFQSDLDRWIISELNQLIIDVDMALNSYAPRRAAWQITAFVDGLSNWYIRRSRRRFWKNENDADKQSAYTTLYECLVTLSKLLAPFTPFLAEELYQNLVSSVFPEAPDSVHLADFPVPDKSKIDKQLVADNRLAMGVCSQGRAVRSLVGIKVRQPLAEFVVGVDSPRERRSLERLKHHILDELNVKTLKLDSSSEVDKLDGHGYVIGRQTRYNGKIEDGKRDTTVHAKRIYKVAVSNVVTPKLAAEGMAREIVHRLQMMRRSAEFDIADYIVTYYQGDAYIRKVMEDFADYIKQETLSRQLIEGVPEEGTFTESYKLGGYDILLGVKRLG